MTGEKQDLPHTVSSLSSMKKDVREWEREWRKEKRGEGGKDGKREGYVE